MPILIEMSDELNTTTANGGAVVFLELLAKTGVLTQRCIRGQGWMDGQFHCAIVLINILGFDRVSDINRLERDSALCTIMRRYEPNIFGVDGPTIASRFRGGRERTFPSARAIHDWLARFHDAEAGQERIAGVAVVPEPAAGISALGAVNRKLVEFLVNSLGLKHVTLDLDATIIGSGKREALKTYRSATGAVPGETGYQPLNVFCPELGFVLHSEMRDGNVPASVRNMEALDAALGQLPAGTKTVTVRSDAAGHQEELLKYCKRPVETACGQWGGAVWQDWFCDWSHPFRRIVERGQVGSR